MATLEVERAPAGSTCTRKTVQYAKYRKRHADEKWRVIQGEGSHSGRVICEACADGFGHQAINRAEQRERDAELAAAAAEEKRLERSSGERYWPWWLLIIGGAVTLGLKLWPLAGLVGLWTLIAFAFFVPVPCRSTVDVDDEPCREWARGFMRACPEFKHSQRQHDLLLEGWRESCWPRLVWDERMAKGAILGAWASLGLIALASGCYLSTVLF